MLILVADDEAIIRMGLKTMLQEMGHQVLTAVNGREAVEMARRHQPDLAILDIKMPFTDGLQAAKTLHRVYPLPVLLLTAYSEQDVIEKATDLPIQGYLTKPVKTADLAAAIVIAHKRFEESQRLLERTAQLEESLESRKLLDRAKGKLMASGLTEEEAYRAIQQRARNQNQSIEEIAKTILS